MRGTSFGGDRGGYLAERGSDLINFNRAKFTLPNPPYVVESIVVFRVNVLKSDKYVHNDGGGLAISNGPKIGWRVDMSQTILAAGDRLSSNTMVNLCIAVTGRMLHSMN